MRDSLATALEISLDSFVNALATINGGDSLDGVRPLFINYLDNITRMGGLSEQLYIELDGTS